MHLIPVCENTYREIPEWASNDNRLRELLLHVYPTLFKKRSAHDARDRYYGRKVRRRAARAALAAYFAWRLCTSDKVIADTLGISRAGVVSLLSGLKQEGHKLFSSNGNGNGRH